MRTVGPVGPINEKTYLAQTALSRGYGAKAGTADGTSTAITAAGQRIVGVVSADVSGAGLPSAITRFGDCPAIAGAAIPFGSYCKVNAVGRFIPTTGTPGEEIAGRAESTASGDGDEFLLFVCPGVL